MIDPGKICGALSGLAKDFGIEMPYNVLADMADRVVAEFTEYNFKPVYVVTWEKTSRYPAGFDWFPSVNLAVDRFVMMQAGTLIKKVMIPCDLVSVTAEDRAKISAWLQANRHVPTDTEIMT